MKEQMQRLFLTCNKQCNPLLEKAFPPYFNYIQESMNQNQRLFLFHKSQQEALLGNDLPTHRNPRNRNQNRMLLLIHKNQQELMGKGLLIHRNHKITNLNQKILLIHKNQWEAFIRNNFLIHKKQYQRLLLLKQRLLLHTR